MEEASAVGPCSSRDDYAGGEMMDKMLLDWAAAGGAPSYGYCIGHAEARGCMPEAVEMGQQPGNVGFSLGADR